MTPLAHDLVSTSLHHQAHPDVGQAVKTLGLNSETHFFECSGVLESAGEIGRRVFGSTGVPGKLAFLPAPRTWLEWKVAGAREAVLLEEIEGAVFTVRIFGRSATGFIINPDPVVILPLHDVGNLAECKLTHESDFNKVAELTWVIYGLLAFINTPRVIGRRQHMPHRGLERRLVAARGMVGRFPLGAWTEIILRVTPPQEAGERIHEAHFTGMKALHFCRAHLRIQWGELVLVSSHWRGDPALGIRRTRYRVEHPSLSRAPHSLRQAASGRGWRA